jgi:hypothetical protein
MAELKVIVRGRGACSHLLWAIHLLPHITP